MEVLDGIASRRSVAPNADAGCQGKGTRVPWFPPTRNVVPLRRIAPESTRGHGPRLKRVSPIRRAQRGFRDHAVSRFRHAGSATAWSGPQRGVAIVLPALSVESKEWDRAFRCGGDRAGRGRNRRDRLLPATTVDHAACGQVEVPRTEAEPLRLKFREFRGQRRFGIRRGSTDARKFGGQLPLPTSLRASVVRRSEEVVTADAPRSTTYLTPVDRRRSSALRPVLAARTPSGSAHRGVRRHGGNWTLSKVGIVVSGAVKRCRASRCRNPWRTCRRFRKWRAVCPAGIETRTPRSPEWRLRWERSAGRRRVANAPQGRAIRLSRSSSRSHVAVSVPARSSSASSRFSR